MTEMSLEEKNSLLEATIIMVREEMARQKKATEKVVTDLEECIVFAKKMQSQRDEARAQLAEYTNQNKIILPGHVDTKGNPKIQL